MTFEELVESIAAKKTTICFVGAGGKTSLITALANRCSLMGRKVLVTTTTHIRKPDRFYASTVDEVLSLWNEESYAVIGTETVNNKLKLPGHSDYMTAFAKADLVLIEADGSKEHPCKIPASHEPVITDDCDIVIGLMGMSAIGKPLKDICFRYETAGEWLETSGETVLSPDIAARILCHEKGTRKNVNNKKYMIVLNQCDNERLAGYAKEIEDIVGKDYDIPVISICLG